MSEKAVANTARPAAKSPAAATHAGNNAPAQTLERTLGNQALARMQPSPRISQPGDADEKEADRVAAQVMARTFDGAAIDARPVPITLQRKCKKCEDEELPVQRKAAGPAPAQPAAAAQAAVNIGGGRPLETPTRNFFESRFGHGFEQVRVHDDAAADRSARALHAKAYTFGQHISFARGEYRPDTVAGKSLLAHELTHVLQQRSGIMPKRIQRFSVESTADCNPAGFTDQNKTGVVNNPDGEVAYTVNGIPTADNPQGVPAKDPENKLIKFPKDTELKLGQTGYRFWTAVCLKRTDRTLSEVHWVRSSGITLQRPAAAAPAPEPAANVAGAESWSGNFSDFDGKTDAEIAGILRSLLMPELFAVAAEAEVRGSSKVTAQANVVLNEYIAAGPDAGHFSAFSSAAQMGTPEQALAVLMQLHSIEQIQMFVAQTDAPTRSNIHTVAMEKNAAGVGGADGVIVALEEYESIVNETGSQVKSEQQLARYHEYFNKDWAKAAEALNHFSDEAIFLELRELDNNDHLRALRKAADRHGYTKVSMIVSAIIAAQDKTGIYLDNLADLAASSVLGMVPIPGATTVARLTGVIDDGWSEDFTKGLIDGGLDTALGDAWASVETQFSSPENVAYFILGYYPGLFVGIAKDLWSNIEGVAIIIATLAKYGILIQFQPLEVLQEIYGLLKGLAKLLLSALDAREFGYTAGRLLSGTVQKEFTDKTPFFKGMQVGEIVGMVLTEIALLFIGVGEATAALKAVRGTKLVIEVENALAKSVKLQKFITAAAESKTLRLLKGSLGAGKGAGLLKGADAARDLVKAEEILVDFAKLEKAGDSAVIAKQMQPLEHAVLTEKVKNPGNIKLPEPPFHTQYTMEVKVGEHTYRRRPDGSWCRFSGKTCGHKINDGLPDGMHVIDEEILPQNIGNGKPQTQRSNLRTRMKDAFDNFQLPSWAKSKPKSNWDAHHVIPWEFLDHGVFNVLREKGLVWDHNAMKNAIALPVEKGIAGAEKLPIHQASSRATRGHPVYNGKVERRLDDLLEKFELDPPTLQKEVDILLAELRGEIEGGKWAGVPQF